MLAAVSTTWSTAPAAHTIFSWHIQRKLFKSKVQATDRNCAAGVVSLVGEQQTDPLTTLHIQVVQETSLNAEVLHTHHARNCNIGVYLHELFFRADLT